MGTSSNGEAGLEESAQPWLPSKLQLLRLQPPKVQPVIRKRRGPCTHMLGSQGGIEVGKQVCAGWALGCNWAWGTQDARHLRGRAHAESGCRAGTWVPGADALHCSSHRLTWRLLPASPVQGKPRGRAPTVGQLVLGGASAKNNPALTSRIQETG